jgi:hypothetical protein
MHIVTTASDQSCQLNLAQDNLGRQKCVDCGAFLAGAQDEEDTD